MTEERDKSGRRVGSRVAILRTPSEVARFKEIWNSCGSRKEVAALLGWDPARVQAVARTLRKRGVDLKVMPGGTSARQKEVEAATKRLPPRQRGVRRPPPPDKIRVKPADERRMEIEGRRRRVDGREYPTPAGKVSGSVGVVERKEAFLKSLVDSRMDVQATCKAMGIDQSTYRRWLKNDAGFRRIASDAAVELHGKIRTTGIKQALGEHPEQKGRPDPAMIRFYDDKLDPEGGKTVKHVHSGTVGVAALRDMGEDTKREELSRLLGMRGIEAEFEVVDGED